MKIHEFMTGFMEDPTDGHNMEYVSLKADNENAKDYIRPKDISSIKVGDIVKIIRFKSIEYPYRNEKVKDLRWDGDYINDDDTFKDTEYRPSYIHKYVVLSIKDFEFDTIEDFKLDGLQRVILKTLYTNTDTKLFVFYNSFDNGRFAIGIAEHN